MTMIQTTRQCVSEPYLEHQKASVLFLVSPMLVAFHGWKTDMIELLLTAGGSPFQPVLTASQLPPVHIPVKRRYGAARLRIDSFSIWALFFNERANVILFDKISNHSQRAQ